MSKKRLSIEWVIAIVLLFFAVKESPYFNYYHLSPLAAHEQSERTYHYGPSNIVESIDVGDVRLYMGTYKEWFSVNSVEKHAGVFWRPGSHVGGTEIDKNQAISYSWSGSTINDDLMLMKIYGVVTNPNIVEVQLDVMEGSGNPVQTLSYPLKDHRMFLFYWNELENPYKWLFLRGVDKTGNTVYEHELS
ncbi:DUF5044 domain-containing protein [Bacillus sp. HMF5848]|uniref:DUF5044 domain-containing protein n=1 Tax=Bacillus sp. HMF5848 TaxID=2495421 RepID=UPI000F76CF76|nr:DUF5044 domain-containing protein [Bacillus sp. HMF5848]RSK27545.1 DUF5044 domain-containing protein [Bacillus sp. HMF5848]